MATQVIDVPGGIPFAGFYYPEILRELLSYLRQNRDRIGLTDENEFEVHVQLLRAFALVGHLNNVRLDVVATELLIDSAGLLESVKRLLRLIGVELASASPAAADLVCKLSEVTTVDQTDFIPELSEFSTDAVPPITFEALTVQDLDRTDQVKYVYGLEETDGSAIVSDTLSMSLANPDVVQRNAGVWPGDAVGQRLFVNVSPNQITAHIGEYRVTERINDTSLRVVKMPGSKTPGFQNDSLIDDWSLKKYTTNFAANANTNASPFNPWATPAVGDMLFVGHRHIQWSQLDLTFTAFGAGIKGVWEYFDNERSLLNPAVGGITDNGSTLTIDCTPLLGTVDRNGALVKLVFLKTGAEEIVKSVWAGGKNQITTAGLLGQVTPSIDEDDYHITAEWVPFDEQEDNTDTGSSAFAQDDLVDWAMPETTARSWLQTDVNVLDAFWLRFRIVSVSTPTNPTFDRIKLDEGDQFLKPVVTQGETIGPQIIGSSTGQGNQEFTLPETPFIDNTETIEVDEGGAGTWVEYARVPSFLSSLATSRHYVRESDAADKAAIRFGDGINGKIPPAGINNIRGTYRVGGDINGNVGVDQITTNADGVSGISAVTNPRPAVGWRMKDGGDDADLERIKREAPAQLRTRDTASTTDDIERLAINNFTDSSGIKPVARAFAVEEGFGAKTIKLLVVGAGGTVLTAAQLEELDEYFNGDDTVVPPTSGVLLTNHKVISVNFEPTLVSIEATVVWPGGSAERVRNQLLAFLTPLAVEDDGFTYVWNFGSQVSFSRVHSLIHEVDPGVQDVPVLKINGVAGSLGLGENELPASTASNITISIQET
jgi:hypothetical protein